MKQQGRGRVCRAQQPLQGFRILFRGGEAGRVIGRDKHELICHWLLCLELC